MANKAKPVTLAAAAAPTPAVAPVAVAASTAAPAATPAPGAATLAPAPVALPLGPNCAPLCGARPAVPLPVAAGALCAVPSTGGMVATFAAPVAASYSTATPPAWPPCYTAGGRGGATLAAPPGAPKGAASYTVPAVLRPATGQGPAQWGLVHCYPGHSQPGVASSPGSGTMVAVAGPVGAYVPGVAPTGPLAAVAKAAGLPAATPLPGQ